jgi:hypothetical protein
MPNEVMGMHAMVASLVIPLLKVDQDELCSVVEQHAWQCIVV